MAGRVSCVGQERINPAFEPDADLTDLDLKPTDLPIQRHSHSTILTSAEDSSTNVTGKERGQWANRAEFFLSCVGLSVGIGNVWRFPFLAYQNGGGAFLIPYITVLLLVGKPMYSMELALGQYCSVGCWTMFKRLCPLSAGIGMAMCVICLIICTYYNVLMSYTVFFMGAVFKSILLAEPLPWEVCDPAWADMSTCYVRAPDKAVPAEANLVPLPVFSNTTLEVHSRVPSAEQYFERFVLQNRDHNVIYTLDNPGPVIWQLALCLMFCWVVVFFCLAKGIQSSGKVVYFTSTFPYVVLLILLVRGVTLDGAVDGIIFLFKPQWDKLLDVAVWRSAAAQVFFSLSVSQGSIMMFGSYNNFRMKVYKDAMIVSILDTVTSLIAGIVIFSVLGSLAYQLDVPVATVAKGGPSLAFVAYPEALSTLPVPHLWAVLFFFMLFILGLDSVFGLLETALTCIHDEIPKMRERKALVTGIACAILFLLALPCVTHAGLQVVDLMDAYGSGFCVILVALCELIAIFWLYGLKRVLHNFEFMMDYKPSLYFRSCWLVIAPFVLLFVFVYSMADYKPFANNDVEGLYPAWADAVGWLIALCVLIQIPVWGCYFVFKQDGDTFRQKWKRAVTPTAEWGPADTKHREEELEYYGVPVHYGFQRDTSDLESIGRANLHLFGPDRLRKSFTYHESPNAAYSSAHL
ncbi:hypothetical protein RvY_16829 [Ramazzottius varieornatus]|uniref:Transporter n=1 Tax=Ramazzottius varieornatus TaxID=947166 RepID=A0A1D1VZW6_RAMVA|nr:hypothetical protein RvY_16829 [Ramazzottius varieornatus]